jgi:hypothetical protein
MLLLLLATTLLLLCFEYFVKASPTVMATIMRPTTPQAAPETKVFGLLFSLEKKTYEMSYLN